MAAINFSKRKKKMRTVRKEEVRDKTPNPLMRRDLLNQVAGLYDPITLLHQPRKGGNSCQESIPDSWQKETNP